MTLEQFRAIATKLPAAKAAEYHPLLLAACAEFRINTGLRMAGFLGQLLVESTELTHWEENLNYSALRLVQVFHRYFPTVALAAKYAHNPQAIANRVYGNRMGNGSEATGDGWKFRGRGPMQDTGADMYRKVGAALGIDLVANPDLLLEPKIGLRAAAWTFVVEKSCLPLADQGTEAAVVAMTHRINGGEHGLDERKTYTARARRVLGAGPLGLPTTPVPAKPVSMPHPAVTGGAAAGLAVTSGAAYLATQAPPEQAVPWLAVALVALALIALLVATVWVGRALLKSGTKD